MTKEILKVKGLSKKFQYNNKDIIVLKNLNFSIKEGELIALTGPSGSGKSTLLHIISFNRKTDKWKSVFCKKMLMTLKSREIDEIRKFKISLIFQNNNLISDLDVAENVMLPLLIRNEDPKSREKSKKILSEVRLSNRHNFFPNDLSGGEQQRVAIARSLIAQSDLILADEPTEI